jgi:hypothetical protein
MGKKSGPPVPDYAAAATATGEASQANTTQQTWANRANQSDPFGSSTWTSNAATDPSTGQAVTQWNQQTTLDPKLQGALNSQLDLQQGRSDLANSLLPRAQQEFSQPMNWGGAMDWAGAPQAAQTGAPTTSAFGFGGPRQQRMDTSRQQAPQLDTSRLATPELNANLGAGAGDVQSGLDFGGVQGVSKAGDTRSRAEDAIYSSAASRLDPQWQQRQQSMESDLANRGISVNSEAYSRAVGDFDRGRNDAYAQAQMNAVTGGGAEAQRDYSMDLGLRQQQVGEIGQQGAFTNAAQQQDYGQRLQAGQANNTAAQSQFGMGAQSQQLQNEALGQGFNFGNTARQTQLGAQNQAYNQSLQSGNYDLQRQQQAFSQEQSAGNQGFNQQLQSAQFQNQTRQNQLTEAMQQRGFSLNEINALMSGQQVSAPQFQGYNQSGVAQSPDYLGAANSQYQGAINSQNAQNAQTQQYIQAAAAVAAMFSDARVKRVVRRVGTHRRGFGIYKFRYIGERGTRVGFIAQEVRRVAPELVSSVRGVLKVDYARA